MRIAILQPNYLPWRGNFDLIASADLFLFYDDAQYTHQDWRNRNQIKTAQGLKWLTVPIQQASLGTKICDIIISQTENWAQKHKNAITEAYRTAPFFNYYADEFFALLEQPWEKLVDLDIATTHWLMQKLQITTPTKRVSELGLSGQKNNKLLAIMQAVGANHYLSGPAAANYLELQRWLEAGYCLDWKTYDYAPYPQLHGDFTPTVSVLDVLFNTGDQARELIRSQTPDRPVLLQHKARPGPEDDWLNNQLPSLPTEIMSKLDQACRQIATSKKTTDEWPRQSVIDLVGQSSLMARRHVFATMAQHVATLNVPTVIAGLQKKIARITPQYQHQTINSLWTTLRQECAAAVAAHDANRILTTINLAHAAAYAAYDQRDSYVPFQDAQWIGAVSTAMKPYRPVLLPSAPLPRPLRICYVLSGEAGASYSPIADISVALAEAHDPVRTHASVLCLRPDHEVAQNSIFQGYATRLKRAGVPIIHSDNDIPAANILPNMTIIAQKIARENFDALIFTTLSNHQFFLAALRPAPLMFGYGLGEIDLYTSPLLDGVAQMVDWPMGEALCPTWRIPPFVPKTRFRQPTHIIPRKEFGVPDKAIMIVSAGRTVKFLSAEYWQTVRQVLQERPQAHLVVVGPTARDLPVQQFLQLHPELVGRIHCLGFRQDFAEILAAADIMLDTFPQGGGYTALEAMNLGLPVVMCRNRVEDFFMPFDESLWQPIGEMLEHPDLVFDRGDLVRIKQALLRLIDEPARRKDLSAIVQAAAAQRADITPTIAALENLISEQLFSRRQ